jgi:hypothetical protein
MTPSVPGKAYFIAENQRHRAASSASVNSYSPRGKRGFASAARRARADSGKAITFVASDTVPPTPTAAGRSGPQTPRPWRGGRPSRPEVRPPPAGAALLPCRRRLSLSDCDNPHRRSVGDYSRASIRSQSSAARHPAFRRNCAFRATVAETRQAFKLPVLPVRLGRAPRGDRLRMSGEHNRARLPCCSDRHDDNVCDALVDHVEFPSGTR